MLGEKRDNNKDRWDLLPWQEVQEGVEVLTWGAEKYDDFNWQEVPKAQQRYFAAMMRHIMAWFGGEQLDQESGKSHLAHALCCLLFLMWFDNNKKEE